MKNEPGPIWRANVLGTRHALDAAREAGARRFLHLSSVTVFSFDFPDHVTEAYPVRANGVPYADTKVASEAACSTSAYPYCPRARRSCWPRERRGWLA